MFYSVFFYFSARQSLGVFLVNEPEIFTCLHIKTHLQKENVEMHLCERLGLKGQVIVSAVHSKQREVSIQPLTNL